MTSRDLPMLAPPAPNLRALRGLAVACAFLPLTASAQLLDTADDLPPPPDETPAAPVAPIAAAVEPERSARR